MGSPPCTPIFPLQEIGRRRRDPKVVAQELERGKRHIRFCVELYNMQLEGKSHFVHEHPARSTAWKMPELSNLKEMVELAMKSEVGLIEMDMCAFGMMSQDEQGDGLVKKEHSNTEFIGRGVEKA